MTHDPQRHDQEHEHQDHDRELFKRGAAWWNAHSEESRRTMIEATTRALGRPASVADCFQAFGHCDE